MSGDMWDQRWSTWSAFGKASKRACMFANSTLMRDKLRAPNQYSSKARCAVASGAAAARDQYARESSTSSAHLSRRVWMSATS
ncbi:MAG: hypothetical protein IPN77_31990 [Sandaracinaceae bacterium]|nr:hypothetical protein [Sandaracinaceae bacterium]